MGGNTNEETKSMKLCIVSIMCLLLLTSNGSACVLRAYKRSRPYLSVNIILLLNFNLIEAFNSITSILVWNQAGVLFLFS